MAACFRSYWAMMAIAWSSRSVVKLTTDHVHGTKRRDDVGQHVADEKFRQRRDDRETGRPHAHAVGPVRAVAHDEKAELPVGAFNGRVGLALRRPQAVPVHHELEMVHEAL